MPNVSVRPKVKNTVSLHHYVLSLVPTGFSRVLTERPHDVADVGDGDLAVAAVVVEQEGLLELGQLVFRELLLHPARHVC